MSVFLLNDPYPLDRPATGGDRVWDANHELAIEPLFGLPAPPLPPLPGLREFVASVRKLVPDAGINNFYPSVEQEARRQGIIPILDNPDKAWTSKANGGNVTPNKSGQYGIAL